MEESAVIKEHKYIQKHKDVHCSVIPDFLTISLPDFSDLFLMEVFGCKNPFYHFSHALSHNLRTTGNTLGERTSPFQNSAAGHVQLLTEIYVEFSECLYFSSTGGNRCCCKYI